MFLRVRNLLSLHKAPLYPFSLYTKSPTVGASICLSRTLCTTKEKDSDAKPAVDPENKSLLERLTFMGVDVKVVRRRQPGVLRKFVTNEQGLAHFLQSKGASSTMVADIISRFPRAITRSREHLELRWELWRSVFKSDSEIVGILGRCPESFFRSNDNENLEKNILFLSSLGFNTKELHRLLTTAPRTFSNSVELNRQMVEFLQDVCTDLGGEDPNKFAKAVINKNLYILLRSIKKVKANIQFLRVALKLSDPELLALLQGSGAQILDLSNDYLKRNFKNLKQKLLSEGCQTVDIKTIIMRLPGVVYMGQDTLCCKLDCLLKGGVAIQQIVEKPKVLELSTQNLTGRLEELHRVGYDFEKDGIAVLESSQKRFDARLERLDHGLTP